MHKCLFLLCPTDCLETVINKNFSGNNYFYTSLGNSITIENNTLKRIKELILKFRVSKLYIVLSDNNQIFLDALGGQYFSNTRGLQNLYKEVASQKQHSDQIWQIENHHFSIFSYFLNAKIKALQFALQTFFDIEVAINGKVYSKENSTFKTIYSDLICLEKQSLN